MEREDKRGIFFGVIGVLTLIVAIIGASLAYFSINAKSDTDALTVKAATVKIVYNDGDKLNVENIIPSSKEVALRTLTRSGQDNGEEGTYTACVDDKGYNVCGFYDFTLTNEGPNTMVVTAKVLPTALKQEIKEEDVVTQEAETPFTNLKFTLYDRSNVSDKTGTGMFDNGTELHSGTFAYSTFNLLGSGDETLSIDGNGAVKNLRLFVWLDEQGTANDAEQGAVFKGTVSIEVPGAENITGTASE